MITFFCFSYLILFLLIGLKRLYTLLPSPLVFGLVLSPLLLGVLLGREKIARRLSQKLLMFLNESLGRRWVTGAGTAALLFIFFARFPISRWNAIILRDDYTSLYGAALRGLKILREGSLFGWDAHLLGGYYTVSDLNFNLTLFLLPFLPFGAAVGYHLLILTFYLLFPFLVERVGRLLLRERAERLLVFIFAAFFAASFFRNILFVGMVDNLIGIDFFLLTLLCFEGTLRKKRRQFLWTVLSLALCGLAHLGYFLYAIGWIAIRTLLDPKRRLRLSRSIAVILLATLLLLPYFAWLIEWRSFFLLESLHFSPPLPLTGNVYRTEVPKNTLAVVVSALKNFGWLESGFEGLKGSNYLAATLLSSLLLLHLFITSRRLRRPVFWIGLLLILYSLKFPGNLALKRVYFLLPLLLAIAWAAIGGRWLRKGSPGGLLVILSILTVSLGVPSLKPIPHVSSLREVYPGVYEMLKEEKGWTLVESDTLWIRTVLGEFPREHREPHAHPEILLALETGGHLLASPKDGYHFSIYRGEALQAGIFQGESITRYPPDQMLLFLKTWGVRHLAVFTETSRDYFRHLPGSRLVWENPSWSLFEFQEGDARRVIAPWGSAQIVREGYTQIEIHLKGVPEGSRVVLRMNHFPGWKAFFEGREIPLSPTPEGLVSFESPTAEEGTVLLRLTVYRWLSGLSLTTLVGLLGAAFGKRREG